MEVRWISLQHFYRFYNLIVIKQIKGLWRSCVWGSLRFDCLSEKLNNTFQQLTWFHVSHLIIANGQTSNICTWTLPPKNIWIFGICNKMCIAFCSKVTTIQESRELLPVYTLAYTISSNKLTTFLICIYCGHRQLVSTVNRLTLDYHTEMFFGYHMAYLHSECKCCVSAHAIYVVVVLCIPIIFLNKYFSSERSLIVKHSH